MRVMTTNRGRLGKGSQPEEEGEKNPSEAGLGHREPVVKIGIGQEGAASA